jgi:membrane protease subunit HflC
MSLRKAAWLALVALLAGFLYLSLFTVGEAELVVRSRFGKVVETGYAPGLHTSLPVDRIERVERRIITQSLQGESFLTSEQQGLVLDIDLSWQVQDAERYLRAAGGDEQAAGARLADAVRNDLKAAYAQQTLAQVIVATHGGFTPPLLAHLQALAQDLGLRLIAAQVQRIDPTDEVATAIYKRMQAAYGAQAKQVRAEGGADAERIRAEAERNRAEILGTASRDAQRLRGEADAQAAAIYARSYGRNPEFAAFYRSLQAYRTAIGREGDVLVIEPEGEFYKYLRNPARH